MNILILAASQNNEDDSGVPFYLLENNGVSYLEMLYKNVTTLCPSSVIFVFSSYEIKKFSLDAIVKLFGNNTIAVQAKESTSGAACSALLAMHYINCKDELLILNANEILGFNFYDAVSHFRCNAYDAGVSIFSSLNPQYSYVRINECDEVVEAAEKKVISRNATSGFYWYKRGEIFVDMAMRMILKRASSSDIFYICPVFNELVLASGRIGVWRFPTSQYTPLKSIRQIYKSEYV